MTLIGLIYADFFNRKDRKAGAKEEKKNPIFASFALLLWPSLE